MKAKTNILLSLLLPLVTPVASLPLAADFAWASFLLVSLIYGGIPYAIFLAGAYIWSIKKDAEAVRRMTIISPIIVAAILTLGLILLQIPSGDFEILTFGLSLITVILGYVYVITVNTIFYVLKATKIIKE